MIDPTMQNNKLSIKVSPLYEFSFAQILSIVTSYLQPVFSECAFSFALKDYEKSGLDILFFGQDHYDTMAILQQREDVDQSKIGNLMESQKLLSNKDLLLKNFKEVIHNL